MSPSSVRTFSRCQVWKAGLPVECRRCYDEVTAHISTVRAEENRLGADIIRMFGASCVLARASTGPRPSRKMRGLLRLEACWLGIRLMRGFLDSSNATVTSQLVFTPHKHPVLQSKGPSVDHIIHYHLIIHFWPLDVSRTFYVKKRRLQLRKGGRVEVLFSTFR